jgi:NAD(P)-dependent dehydrogenase (short-subunit alcohol dehydrogenase family)
VNQVDIKGKIALVTGANRGIGKNIVETFLQNGAKKVYVGVRMLDSVSDLQKKHGEKIVPLLIDLEKPETITLAAKKAQDVEILVNNAGVYLQGSPLDDSAISNLEFQMQVNVYGLMRMAKAFAPILKANGGGVIVQLNSIASLKCFLDGATYSASKAAAYSITQGLREQLAEQGTLVVSVHPGPIVTDMAVEAGFAEMGEHPDVVSLGIIDTMKNGQFHLFPDQLSKKLGNRYQSFGKDVVEADFGDVLSI